MLAADRDGSIVIRNSASGQELHSLKEHKPSFVWCLTVVGNTIWCGTETGPITVYNQVYMSIHMSTHYSLVYTHVYTYETGAIIVYNQVHSQAQQTCTSYVQLNIDG